MNFTFNAFCDTKAERLYSIASSLDANPDEVHLTVAAVEYQKNKQLRMGTASHYLTEFQEGEKLAVYLKENNHFRLPENPDTPIIMVGPGTGVAPFRGFIQHRQALGQSGKNWLFFGHQYFHNDFLYQLEWQKHLTTGALNRLDVAFSRDQAEKNYVQHRISENARDVYDWLEQGAAIYICGDATHMAKDVEDSFLQVIQSESAKDRDFAKAYLSQMKAQKRFLKDVY